MRRIRLTKCPRRRGDIEELRGHPVDQSEPEGQPLAQEVDAALPVRSPVPVHGRLRPRPRPPHRHSLNISSAADVRDQHHVKIGFPLQGKMNSTSSLARRPTIDSDICAFSC